jgi:2-(1,2-epoxy-1,2-dihydrophenyl)acetyl-CoA isomerase
LIRADRHDGVLRVVIDRPERKNALTPELRDDLTATFDAASADHEVRAVLLGGAGGAFCAGADLAAGSNSPPGTTQHRVEGDIRRGWQRLIAAVLDCEKPVVAAVTGVAAGGGAHLALACDLVVAADDARIVEVFVRRGLAPDAGGAWLLPRLVGLARAKELVFFGDAITGAEAAQIGLVNRAVPAADVEHTATGLAARLAAGPTRAIAAAKSLLNRSFESARAVSFADEATAQELVHATADAAEGRKAFAERREPRFQGR